MRSDAGDGAEARKEIRQIKTRTPELRNLAKWLRNESSFERILVNARHIKQVSGRKTNKADSAWLASLLANAQQEVRVNCSAGRTGSTSSSFLALEQHISEFEEEIDGRCPFLSGWLTGIIAQPLAR